MWLRNNFKLKNLIDLLPPIKMQKMYFSKLPPIDKSLSIVNLEPDQFVDENLIKENSSLSRTFTQGFRIHPTVTGVTEKGTVVIVGNFTSQKETILTKDDGTSIKVINIPVGFHPITKRELFFHPHSETYMNKDDYYINYAHNAKYCSDLFKVGTCDKNGFVLYTGDQLKNYICSLESKGFIHDISCSPSITYNVDNLQNNPNILD